MNTAIKLIDKAINHPEDKKSHYLQKNKDNNQSRILTGNNPSEKTLGQHQKSIER